MKTFTVDQIRKYIKSKDSLGDVVYFLSEEAIEEANKVTKVKIVEDEDDDTFWFNFEFEDGTIQEDVAGSYEAAEELANDEGYVIVEDF